jgi:hypothetical protein
VFAGFETHGAPEGGKMQNSEVLDYEVESQLENVGGEPLAGSGFEDERPESGFAPNVGEEE